jgi:hypothetical protein
MVLVSVTRLHLKSPVYLPAFIWHTALSTWQIINIPGFLGGRLWGDAHGASWTLSVWEDKSAMHNYRNSGAHRRVMPRLQKWCDEAAVVHWEQVDSSLPNVMEAHRRIVNGHFTRLSSPSLAHLERHIPEPSADIKGLLLGSRKKVQPKVVESQT